MEEDIINPNTNQNCCEPSVPLDVPCCTRMDRPQSMMDRLIDRQKRLEHELGEVNTAIDALGVNNEVYNAINAITRVFGSRLH